MNENERCPECGSWGEECAFPAPQAGCGCARCLRASRDSAQKQAADLTKILMREGGVEGAYERRLAEALRERDEARAEVERLRDTVESLEADFARRQAAHRCATWDDGQGTCECNNLARTVAERQREACAKAGEKYCRTYPELQIIEEVRATPLVTEGDK